MLLLKEIYDVPSLPQALKTTQGGSQNKQFHRIEIKK